MAVIRVGACSWADRSLVRDGSFYPRKSMRAADRLRFYASHLDVVEVSSTHWFPPTPEQSAQWAARTPPGFRFDVQAWSLFTGHGTIPESLWPDLQDEVKPDARDRRRLYADHLSLDARAEAWLRFRHALHPLAGTGRLGSVVLRLPSWVRPGRTATAMLEAARQWLQPWPVAVELANHRWHDGDQCEETLAQLEDLDLALVCVDAARATPVVAATTGLAVVRFAGRRTGRWSWPYRYAPAELAPWLDRIRALDEGADDVHVLFANCHADDAVTGALWMRDLLVPRPEALTLF